MALKGILGSLPYLGPLSTEILGMAIQNQRADRIAGFLIKLDKKLNDLDQELLKVKMLTPGFIELFEDTLYHVRVAKEQRQEYIAALVKTGLTAEEADYDDSKYMLSLLSEINDVEVLFLRAYNDGWRGEFVEKHLAILQAEPDSPDETRIIRENYVRHLIRLDLLNEENNIEVGPIPQGLIFGGRGPGGDEYSPPVKLTQNRPSISDLGRLLLKYIDLEPGGSSE